MARKKAATPETDVARTLGGVLRDLRKSAGYRAVKDAAATSGCPAALQTIYAYERGGLVPSLPQFLELVEFYALKSNGATAATRYMAVAAVHTALSSPAFHVTSALDLVRQLQPPPSPGRRRTSRRG